MYSIHTIIHAIQTHYPDHIILDMLSGHISLSQTFAKTRIFSFVHRFWYVLTASQQGDVRTTCSCGCLPCLGSCYDQCVFCRCGSIIHSHYKRFVVVYLYSYKHKTIWFKSFGILGYLRMSHVNCQYLDAITPLVHLHKCHIPNPYWDGWWGIQKPFQLSNCVKILKSFQQI